MKHCKFLIIITLLITSAAAVAQKNISKPKTDTLIFEDFLGNTLNRKLWNVEITGNTVNNEQQAYIDSAATLYLAHDKEAEGAKKGVLVIKALYQPGYVSKEGHSYDFVSGRINTRTKFEFTYGTASARMKMVAGAGMWPAFWALGKGKWPDCGEIDVMETVGDSSWVSHALHGPGYFGNTPIAYRAFFTKGMDVSQWHIYSVDWTPNTLVFKVDGQLTYTVTREMVDKYGRWAYDNPKFIILNFALGGGYPNGVNKITLPYFGLSQTSVNRIKAGQAKVLIDWVLVTKNK